MAEYSATRRTPRKHKRVVMKGTEQFDADGAPTLCFPQPVGCGKHSIGRRPIPLPTAQRP